jgi:hypothetical protein
MAIKLKINFSTTVEPNSYWYEDNTSPEEMLQIEIENAKDDPIDFLSSMSYEDIVISGEVIRE